MNFPSQALVLILLPLICNASNLRTLAHAEEMTQVKSSILHSIMSTFGKDSGDSKKQEKVYVRTTLYKTILKTLDEDSNDDNIRCCDIPPTSPPSDESDARFPSFSECSEDNECQSSWCGITPSCLNGCCIPEEGMENGSRCNTDVQCTSGYCSEIQICAQLREAFSGCKENNDCVSGKCEVTPTCANGCCSPEEGPVIYEEKKLVASDGRPYDKFGWSCSMAYDLVLIGIDNDKGAAYLFHLDGTEVAKLTSGDDGEVDDRFGTSVSMDKKIVVGTYNFENAGGYVRVFSRDGIYKRTIRCDDCRYFGKQVATHGNLIVTKGEQNDINKLFIYSTEDGQLLKSLEPEDDIYVVAISEQFIVTTGFHKTFIYSNTSPDFPKIAEINEGGETVAVAGDRIVIGNYYYANNFDGAAWLYKTDGTLVKTLDRQDASSGSWFGRNVAITDDKVFVGAWGDDVQGEDAGSVFIYSAVTGEFITKVVAGKTGDGFGVSVCASNFYYVVGAPGVDTKTGAAYLFQLP